MEERRSGGEDERRRGGEEERSVQIQKEEERGVEVLGDEGSGNPGRRSGRMENEKRIREKM